ncbi:hypothetical protein J4Q44_G00155440 [Coregonus suidteri]|uniref:Uncharacterized protein n=1 Tax=Coregonus suidteri TaxID=861788 RepID=A0AAN8LLG9_9TELE
MTFIMGDPTAARQHCQGYNTCIPHTDKQEQVVSAAEKVLAQVATRASFREEDSSGRESHGPRLRDQSAEQDTAKSTNLSAQSFPSVRAQSEPETQRKTRITPETDKSKITHKTGWLNETSTLQDDKVAKITRNSTIVKYVGLDTGTVAESPLSAPDRPSESDRSSELAASSEPISSIKIKEPQGPGGVRNRTVSSQTSGPLHRPNQTNTARDVSGMKGVVVPSQTVETAILSPTAWSENPTEPALLIQESDRDGESIGSGRKASVRLDDLQIPPESKQAFGPTRPTGSLEPTIQPNLEFKKIDAEELLRQAVIPLPPVLPPENSTVTWRKTVPEAPLPNSVATGAEVPLEKPEGATPQNTTDITSTSTGDKASNKKQKGRKTVTKTLTDAGQVMEKGDNVLSQEPPAEDLETNTKTKTESESAEEMDTETEMEEVDEDNDKKSETEETDVGDSKLAHNITQVNTRQFKKNGGAVKIDVLTELMSPEPRGSEWELPPTPLPPASVPANHQPRHTLREQGTANKPGLRMQQV